MEFRANLSREDINGKENDIVQKGGGVRKKINLCYVLLKVTFYLGRGVDQNQVIFQNVFPNI